jgi:2'-5' RNA ligase
MRRLFIALWPDPDTRIRIARLLSEGSGRRIPQEQLHLTLVFVGAVEREVSDCLEQRLDELQFDSFELTLDRFGFFVRPGILWVGPSSIPRDLVQMRDRARQIGLKCGLRVPNEEYVPHVSLFRGCVDSRTPDWQPALSWHVDTVALIESGEDGQAGPYRMISNLRARHRVRHPSLSGDSS